MMVCIHIYICIYIYVYVYVMLFDLCLVLVQWKTDVLISVYTYIHKIVHNVMANDIELTKQRS